MNRGARLMVVAAIVIAIAGVATFMALSSHPDEPAPPVDNGGNSTQGKQITVELSENLSVEAK